MYSHYIITRFNVREPSWTDVDKNSQRTLTDSWMRERFKLFDRYCVPSVLAQTNKNFKWLVLFDQRSGYWKDKIWHEYGYILTPVYCGKTWLSELQRYLTLDCTTKHCITTRLDNDDAIAPNMIERVQGAFRKQQFTFLDSPRGYRLKDGNLYSHKEPFNPFMSLVESTRKSVLSVPHGATLAKQHEVQALTSQPMYLQVIHNRNKITDTTQQPARTKGWVSCYVG